MSKENDTPERPFKTFLRGTRNGIFLGGWYAIASTMLRYGLATDPFLSIDFVIRFVVAAVIGLILRGAWEVLAAVMLRRYASSHTAKKRSSTQDPFLVAGAVRSGLPFGLFMAFATTFAKPGISLERGFLVEFILGLCIYVPASIAIEYAFVLQSSEIDEDIQIPVGTSRD